MRARAPVKGPKAGRFLCNHHGLGADARAPRGGGRICPPRARAAPAAPGRREAGIQHGAGGRVKVRVAVVHQRGGIKRRCRLLHDHDPDISRLELDLGVRVEGPRGGGEHADGGGGHGEDLVVLVCVEGFGVGEDQVACVDVLLDGVEGGGWAGGRGGAAGGGQARGGVREELAEHDGGGHTRARGWVGWCEGLVMGEVRWRDWMGRGAPLWWFLRVAVWMELRGWLVGCRGLS